MTDDFELQLRDALAAARLPSAPPSLSHLLADLATEPVVQPKQGGRRWVAWAAIATLAFAIVSFSGTVILLSGNAAGRAGPGPATPSIPPLESPSPTAAASASASPDALDGLHLYEVGELQEAMVGPDRPPGRIGLRGFWSDRTVMHSCAMVVHSETNLEGYCHDGEWGITERNEPILVWLPGGVRGHAGPALTPWIPDTIAAKLFGLPIINKQQYTPVPIVVIGHIDDPRASECAENVRQICIDRFVIEELVSFDPTSVPAPTPTPVPSPFPYDNPPPSPFAVADCVGDIEPAFVGWKTMGEIGQDIGDPDEVLFVVIAKDFGEVEGWTDDPAGSGRRYRAMAQSVCYAHEWEQGAIGFTWFRGSAYHEWDDGTRTPIDP